MNVTRFNRISNTLKINQKILLLLARTDCSTQSDMDKGRGTHIYTYVHK